MTSLAPGLFRRERTAGRARRRDWAAGLVRGTAKAAGLDPGCLIGLC